MPNFFLGNHIIQFFYCEIDNQIVDVEYAQLCFVSFVIMV